MGLLTFALNVTLDGCCDHREGIADDELHRYFTRLMDAAGGMLWGRKTYELMESHWPTVARDPKAPRSHREWARKLDAKPKYVVSATRRDFPWSNTHRIEGDLAGEIAALKRRTPRGLLVGSPMLSAELQRLGLIDEYRFVVHPIIAGHGPAPFAGLPQSSQLRFVDSKRFKSGVLALRYRPGIGGIAMNREKAKRIAYFLLRVVAGLLFLQAGGMKMFDWFGGVPAQFGGHPKFLSQIWIGGALEFWGGTAILLGLWTRPVAFILSGEMAVAYFQFHQPNGFWPIQNHGEPAVLLCFIFLLLAAHGGGDWSLDSKLSRRK